MGIADDLDRLLGSLDSDFATTGDLGVAVDRLGRKMLAPARPYAPPAGRRDPPLYTPLPRPRPLEADDAPADEAGAVPLPRARPASAPQRSLGFGADDELIGKAPSRAGSSFGDGDELIGLRPTAAMPPVQDLDTAKAPVKPMPPVQGLDFNEQPMPPVQPLDLPAPKTPEGPSLADDLARQAIGGMYKGTGAAIRGIGTAVQTLGEYTTTPIVNKLLGTKYRTENVLDPVASSLSDYGEHLQKGVSPETKAEIKASTPGGDIFKPSTWTFGDKPSVRGYMALGTDVMGQMVPIVMASVASGGSATAGAIAGGAQGGGSAVEEARKAIDTLAATGKLAEQSAYYRDLIAQGVPPAEALQTTRDAAERWAFILTTPVSAFGGAATSALIHPATKVAGRSGLAGRAATRIGAGAAEEGTQEVTESIQTKRGINTGAGTNLDVTEGTFGDFVLGSLAGGGTAAPAALLSRRDPLSASSAPSAAAGAAPTADVGPSPTGPSSPEDIAAFVRQAEATRPPPPPPDAEPPKADPLDPIREFMGTKGLTPEQVEAMIRGMTPEDLRRTMDEVAAAKAKEAPQAEAAPEPDKPHAGSAKPHAATDVDEAQMAVLHAYGYSRDQVLKMAPRQREAEQQDAIASGIDPQQALDGYRRSQASQSKPEVPGGIPGVEGDEHSLQQSKNDALSPLRGAGDQGVRRMAGEFPGLSGVSRPPTISEPFGGQDRQQQGLRAGQHSVGDSNRTGVQQEPRQKIAPPDVQRRDANDRAMGAQAEYRPDNTTRAISGRLANREGADPAHRPRPDVQGAGGSRPIATFGAGDPQVGTRSAVVPVETAQDLQAATQRAAIPYTPAQGEANNRPLGHARWNGLDLSIETPAGGVRKGIDKKSGQPWETTMGAAYGYIKGTKGGDGMHLDAFIGDQPESQTVYVINENDRSTGKYRQSKVMIGFPSREAAIAAYTGTSSKSAADIGGVATVDVDGFKNWLATGNTRKAFPVPKADTPRAPRPPRVNTEPTTLLQMIAFRGGLKPTPELRAMGITSKDRIMVPGVGWRSIMRGKGLTLDEVAEAMVEEGFLPPESELRPGDSGLHNQIREMIDEERRGRPSVRMEDQGRATRGDQARIDDENAQRDAVLADNRAEVEALVAEYNLPAAEQEIRRAAEIMADEGLAADDALERAALRADVEEMVDGHDEIADAFGYGAFDDEVLPLAAYEDGAEAARRFEDAEGAERAEAEAIGEPASRAGEDGERQGETAEGGHPDVEAPGRRAGDQREAAEAADAAADAQDAADAETAEEVGADNKPQLVIPGAEKASDAVLAQRKADAPLKPKKAQEQMDVGMFGDDSKQTDLLDAVNKKPASKPAQAPSSDANWLGALSEADRELAFAEMRAIGKEADAANDKAAKYTPRGGAIAVGATHWDEFIAAETRYEFLRHIRKGKTPEAAEIATKEFVREAVAKHNKQRANDVNWQRSDGMMDNSIMFLRNRMERAVRSAQQQERAEVGKVAATAGSRRAAPVRTTTRETNKGVEMFSIARLRRPERKMASEALSLRRQGVPASAGKVISEYRNDSVIKAHPDYAAAKSGSVESAARLVEDTVSDASIAAASERFGPDAIYAPVVALEHSGHNQIPAALSEYYAARTGARAATGIVQSNQPFHTGANAMERLSARAEFDGPVERGGRYVLVDDVTVMGSTLADFAHHIQSNGGTVIGVVTLANAGRSGILTAPKAAIAHIVRRFGDAIKDAFDIEPASLTADEAAYIRNFRDTEALRNRVAAAERQRRERLLSKGISEAESQDSGVSAPEENGTSTGAVSDSGEKFSLRPEAPMVTGFYSAVERAIGNVKQAKAPAEQWLNTIRNLPGVKAEEMEWLGLDDWLKEQKGAVTKDALLDYVRANQIEVKEVEKGAADVAELEAEWERAADAVNAAIRARKPDAEQNRLRDIRDDIREKIEQRRSEAGQTKFSQYTLPGGENYRELLLTLPADKQSDRLQELETRYNAGRMTNLAEREEYHGLIERGVRDRNYRSSHWDEPNILAHVRFNDRTIDGKKTLFIEEIQSDWGQSLRKSAPLRELAKPQSIRELTENFFGAKAAPMVSLQASDAAVLPMLQHDEVRQAVVGRVPVDVVNILKGLNVSPDGVLRDLSMLSLPRFNEVRGRVLPGLVSALRDTGALLRAKLLDASSAGRDEVILPALRASDLSAREIVGVLAPQSIYHDAAAVGSLIDRPASSGAVLSPTPSDIARVAPKDLTADGTALLRTPLVTRSGAITPARSAGAEAKSAPATVADLLDWHNQIVPSDKKQQYRASTVPSMPFEKTWAELSIKRMIRFAAERGYDQIAWTPGEVQADRYDLSKQIKEIEYVKNADGTYRLGIADKEGEPVGALPGMDVNRMTLPQIEETVGKEIAQKIENGEGRKYRGHDGYTLEGLDLKVGGEGMRGFYDKILPATVNKLVKKFGVRVGQGELPAGDEVKIRPATDTGGGWEVYRTADEFVLHRTNGREGAESFARDYASTRVHTLPITDALRKAALVEGFPLFKLSDSPAAVSLRADLEQQLTAIIERMVGRRARIRFEDTIPINGTTGWGSLGEGSQTAAGAYAPASALIRLAMADPTYAGNERSTAFHEAFHALEHLIWREQGPERDVLLRERDRLENWILANMDLGLGRMTKEQLAEMAGFEIRAIAFEGYARKREMGEQAGGIHVAIRRGFERLMAVLRRIRNYLEGLGYRTAEDVFSDVYEGKVRERADAAERSTFEGAAAMADRGEQYSVRRARPRSGNIPTPGFQVPHESVREALTDDTMPVRQRLSVAIDALMLAPSRAIWDRLIDLSRFQRAAEIASGQETQQNLDTYLAASIYPGRVGERLKDIEKLIRPVIEELKARNIGRDELHDYLYARHAGERNDQIRSIDPANDAGSGMTDQEAQDILNNAAPRQADFDAVAALVDNIVRFNRDLMEAEGLESRQTLMQWSNAYRHYVPLKGAENQESDQIDPKTGKGFTTRGPESRRALGRFGRADDILTNLLEQTQRTIIRAEKNRVAKTFLRWVQRNPTPLITHGLAETRREVNKTTGLVETVWVTTAKDARNVFAAKIAGETHYMRIEHDGLLLALKSLDMDRLPPFVAAVARFTRQFAAFQTARNPEFVFSNLSRDLQDAGFALNAETKRGFQRAFWKHILNGKALMGAVLGQLDKTNNRYGRLYEEWRLAGGKISSFGYKDLETIRRELEDELARSTESMTRKVLAQPARLVNPYSGHIVKTFEAISDVAESMTRLAVYAAARDVGMTQAMAATAARSMTVDFQAKGKYGPWISAGWAFANPAIHGSVNLIRRLRRSKRMRYAAGGVAMFGFALTLWNLAAGEDDDEDGRKINRYADLKYHERERNIIIFWPGKKEPTKWSLGGKLPLGYALAPFFMMGENAAMAIQGKKKPLEAFTDWLGTAAKTFNPLGGEGSIFAWHFWLGAISPTIFDPVVELGRNRNWLNRPIHPDEMPWTRGKPRSEQSKVLTNPLAISAAETFNRWTGGNHFKKGAVDLYPDDLEYAWNFALGGYGKFMSNMYGITADKIAGVDTPPERIPFVRRFIVPAQSQSREAEKYYDAANESTERARAIRDAFKAQKSGVYTEDAQKTLEELAPKVGAKIGPRGGLQIETEMTFRDANKELSVLRQQERQARTNSNLERAERADIIKEIRERQAAIMQQARRAYRNISEPQVSP